MEMHMHVEMINLVKSLRGTYKKADREMVVEVVNAYKQEHNCSYKHAYEMTVDGNPSFSAYTSWRHKLTSISNTSVSE